MTSNTQHTPRQELIGMARAFSTAMGREFVEGDRHDAPAGAWYIERAATQKALYRLAERLPHGAVSHPLTSAAMSAQGLADALYIARLAVGMDRDSLSRKAAGEYHCAVLRIHELLDGRQWSADTVPAIADVLRGIGFTIDAPREG